MTPLERSVALAHEARAAGDAPFGAVLVSASGEVLAEGLNRATTGGDVTLHAEIDALRAYAGSAAGATMYTSGEPCPMCAAAMVWAGVARVVYAAAAADFGPLLPPGPAFTLSCEEVVAASNGATLVDGPHLGEAALAPFG